MVGLAILLDRLCPQTVPRRRTLHGLWTGFCNRLQPLFQRMSRTLVILLWNSESYHNYHREPCWWHCICHLYTPNIPHEEGITACKEFLNMRNHLVPSTAYLCHFIQLILTMNSFSLNSNYHLQIYGTAMSIGMAISVANLFMGRLESEFLLTQNVKP